MARQWKVWDNWEGGGFFAGGSHDASERYDSVNMQRYQNGSIGPRPGWRKQTMTAGAAQSLATISSANKAYFQYGFGWHNIVPTARRGEGHSIGVFLHPGGSATQQRNYYPTPGSKVTKVWAMADVASLLNPEAFQINAFKPQNGSGSGRADIGPKMYNASADTVATITPGAGNLALAPRHTVFHKGRLYGFADDTGLASFMGGTDSAALTTFNSGDAFSFELAGRGQGGSAVFFPVGAWPLPNGLLIYCEAGFRSSNTQYNTLDNTGRGTEVGQWFILTGTSLRNGTLTPLGMDAGPLFYSLSIVHEGKVLFPIYQRGWAVHDGTKVDAVSLADLRPGKGSYANGTIWYNPVKTLVKRSLVLPYFTTTVDPTDDSLSNPTADEFGEFYNFGYGAYEFINGAWTESSYLHGQGDLVGYSEFENDKLAVMHLDSADSGANFTPVIWTRDTTLDRPATLDSVADTYNPASSAEETAPTWNGSISLAGGATGIPECKLMTGEAFAPAYSSTKLEAIVVDYDYWNNELFPEDCGFAVEVIYRSGRTSEKLVQQVTTSRVTPPGESTSYFPSRARAVLNLPSRVTCGSFQVKLTDLVGCAIHSIAVAHDPIDVGGIR